MSGPDWYRWYPAKWASGVVGLNPEQRGVYMDVINIILDRGECPEDYEYLSKACNCRSDRVKRIIGELCAKGKLEKNGQTIANLRAKTERSSAENFANIQRFRVSKRWKNNGLADTITENTITTTTTEQERKKERTSATQTRPAVAGPTFDDLWQLQRMTGQRRGKGKAAKAWRAACKRAPPERITAAFAEHQNRWECNGTEVGFIPHLATWLNQDRWQDDLPSPRPKGANGNGSHRPTAEERNDRIARQVERDIFGPRADWVPAPAGEPVPGRPASSREPGRYDT